MRIILIIKKHLKKSRYLLNFVERYREQRYNASIRRNFHNRELNELMLAELIKGALDEKRPLSIVRPGRVELDVLNVFLKRCLKKGTSYSIPLLAKGELNAGISPQSSQVFDEFSIHYLKGIVQSDLLVHFNWTSYVATLPMCRHLKTLNYFYFDPILQWDRNSFSWLNSLKGKKVLVISPFKNSIESQYRLRKEITIVKDLLPDFELNVLKPPITFAGHQAKISWLNELRHFKKQMLEIDYDVALVSAGSYGISIANFAKENGKVGIHVGGALQLFFGIMGKRWEDGAYYLDNRKPLEGWIRPSIEELPTAKSKVEDGCYW